MEYKNINHKNSDDQTFKTTFITKSTSGSGTLASKCVMRQPITGLWAGGP
jgi:hypothetical protein